MRAACSSPLGGAHQHFAISFAIATVKFVDRHAAILCRVPRFRKQKLNFRKCPQVSAVIAEVANSQYSSLRANEKVGQDRLRCSTGLPSPKNLARPARSVPIENYSYETR